MSGHHNDEFRQTRRVKMNANKPQRSRLAVIALALGFAAWALPMMPLIVLGLAVLAWVTAKQSAGARKMAAGALALGVLGLGMQGTLGYGLYQDLRRGPAPAAAQSKALPEGPEVQTRNEDERLEADEAKAEKTTD